MRQFHLFLADAILVTHALIVLFNVVMLPVIWLGGCVKWRFVRNFYLRAIHLLLILFVAVQALAGEICPLTKWENALRVSAGADGRYAESFVTHWLQRLIFCEADEWVFTTAYAVFFALTVLTLFAVKPLPPGCRRRDS